MKTTKKALRLTRRSYRRKFVMFGVSVFMSLALTATGFAAWVLSTNAKKEVSGEVEVGAVTEASIEVSNIVFTKEDANKNPIKNFIFEPLEDDTTGRVQYDTKSAPENLDLKIKWSISNYQSVGEHFVEFKIPENVYKAITEGYIALPTTEAGEDIFTVSQDPEEKDYYVAKYNIGAVSENGNDGKLVTYEVSTVDGVVTATFEMTLGFVWGDVFGKTNPGLYYDDDKNYASDSGKGAYVDYVEVKKTLDTFKATVHGMTYDEYNDLEQAEKDKIDETNPIPNYKVIVNAKVKK